MTSGATDDSVPLHLEDEPGTLFPGGITMHEHRPVGDGPGPRAGAGVVVLPIQGGDYDVSIWFARRLAAAGYRALRFERRAEWLEADRDLALLPVLVHQYVSDVRRGLDRWLAAGDVDDARVGLLGISMGAITGTMVAGSDPRIRSTVLALGGGGLVDILADADDDEVNTYRRDVAARLGISEAELPAAFREAFADHDNLGYAPTVDRDRTLMISARFDRVVRWQRTLALWEALGRPARKTLPCGHYSAAVFLPLIRWWVVRWFDRHLRDGG